MGLGWTCLDEVSFIRFLFSSLFFSLNKTWGNAVLGDKFTMETTLILTWSGIPNFQSTNHWVRRRQTIGYFTFKVCDTSTTINLQDIQVHSINTISPWLNKNQICNPGLIKSLDYDSIIILKASQQHIDTRHPADVGMKKHQSIILIPVWRHLTIYPVPKHNSIVIPGTLAIVF